MNIKLTSTLTEQQWLRWWSKQREQGRNQFVVRRVMMLAAGFSVLYPGFRYFGLSPLYATGAAVIVWVLLSALLASVIWKRNENRFIKAE